MLVNEKQIKLMFKDKGFKVDKVTLDLINRKVTEMIEKLAAKGELKMIKAKEAAIGNTVVN